MSVMAPVEEIVWELIPTSTTIDVLAAIGDTVYWIDHAVRSFVLFPFFDLSLM